MSQPTNASSAAEPHPEIAGLLEQMGATPAPGLTSLSPDGARAFTKQMFPDPEEPTPVGDVMDLEIGELGNEFGIRVYVPEGEGPFSTLLYFHGGGWVLGDIDSYDETCRRFVDETGAMVVSVDYRLAPEHQFPTPLNDCYTAAEWVVNNAESMQIDENNIAIGGDSAGANLAAAVTLLARDRGGPEFTHQVLIYPVTDYAFDTDSYEENADGYLLTKDDMETFWNQYLPNKIDGKNPYASPLQARNLADLPPATVVTCGFDPLRDEGAAYAHRLSKAGVEVNYINYDDAIHGIVQMVVEPMILTRAVELIDDVSTDLSDAFE